jgi:lytic murein transglycosylase
MRFHRLIPFALACSVLIASPVFAACKGADGFPAWLKTVKKEALAQGIEPATLNEAQPYLFYDPAIVKRDRAQGVFAQSFLQFSARMVSNDRINRGRALIQKNKPIFDRIQKRYGVPPQVLTGFWGLETDFGANLGNSPTLTALATLAYDCRRPEKFRPQLFAALQLLQAGDLPAEEMRGAWAGEIGQTQFMPGDYITKGVDFDGDGRRDLRQAPDALASTANFLQQAGWKAGQPWLQEVRVPTEMPWQEADLAIRHPRSQWVKWGVRSAGGKSLPSDSVQASLLLPMGRNGPAFLAYDNFRIYIAWNESLVYSTTAAYYATRLSGAGPVSRGNGEVTPLDVKQIFALQKMLVRRGYDVGEVDGKLGASTRAAVKDMQIKLNLPADSYPTPEFLDALERAG